MAGEGTQGGDAGKLGQTHGDRGEMVVAEIFRHRHGLEAGGARQLGADAGHRLRVEAENPGEGGDRALGIFELVGDQVDPEDRTVDRHRLSVAVDDPAAPGRDQPLLDAIGFGEAGVALVLGDRDIAHPARQQGGEAGLADAEQQRAAGEGRRLRRFGHRRGRRALHRPSRQRSSPITIRATIG